MSSGKSQGLFCEMALEEASNAELRNKEEEETLEQATVDPIALCKIHFKKAKALRLSAEYKQARSAINDSS